MSAGAGVSTRELVVAALESASVPCVRSDPRVAGFLAGGGDIPFADVDMDSLALMEFCITIELEAGVSIVPDEMRRLRTLDAVARWIGAQRP